MSNKKPAKRIKVIPVRRSSIDMERFAAAIVALAHHLRQGRPDGDAPQAVIKTASEDRP